MLPVIYCQWRGLHGAHTQFCSSKANGLLRLSCTRPKRQNTHQPPVSATTLPGYQEGSARPLGYHQLTVARQKHFYLSVYGRGKQNRFVAKDSTTVVSLFRFPSKDHGFQEVSNLDSSPLLDPGDVHMFGPMLMTTVHMGCSGKMQTPLVRVLASGSRHASSLSPSRLALLAWKAPIQKWGEGGAPLRLCAGV